MITRVLESALRNRIMDPGLKKKVLILYGARQVGKTTLLKEVVKQTELRSGFFNCDYYDIQQTFAWENAGNLAGIVNDLDILVLDEAHRIRNIGMVLKILFDEFPHLQVIASGSSSFELSNKIQEPLTGRKVVHLLYPLTYQEFQGTASPIEAKRTLNKILRFGLYPSVITGGEERAQENLKEIASSYLFKDILDFQNLKKPELLSNLLKLIAFQIGSEVSYTELANQLRVDQTVVQRYIQLLEDNFVIFRLSALKRNLRSEIVKSRKIYFWDIGIRNAIIQQFNPIDFRTDIGALWENFCVAERLKHIHYQGHDLSNSYFWRNYAQKEIDYIEEREGKFLAFEFKWSPRKKSSLPDDFKNNYPVNTFKQITPDSISELFS